MKTRLFNTVLTSLGLALVPTSAIAAPDADAGGSVSVGGGDATASAEAEAPETKDRGDKKWINRWGPERNMVELGVFGGVFLPNSDLELFQPDPNQVDQGYKEFKKISPEVGGRIAYYPSRFLGLELEGAVMPNEVGDNQQANIYGLRGHLVANLIPKSITPFLLVGGGGLGVASRGRNASVGADIDASAHFGGGLKFFLDRQTTLRLEARDNITASRGLQSGVTHSVDILFGLSLALGRAKEPAPAPILDTDGDGILDPDDKCVDVPGIAPDGCPDDDIDKDGILNNADSCPEVPETKNGFEDEDGCPDELPEEIKAFSGVIEGIYFDTNRDSIKKKSETKLQNAADILAKFPSIRIEISGHTDSQGNDDYNAELSQRRADAVKQWLIDHGIDGGRLETRGAGENEPIASNKSKSGRGQNRRIEFRLLDQ